MLIALARPDGSPTCEEARRAGLVVGKRVGVRVGSPVRDEQGSIVENLDGRVGCMVLLDGWEMPLQFYWHEVYAARAMVFVEQQPVRLA